MKHYVFTAWNVARNLAQARARAAQQERSSLDSVPRIDADEHRCPPVNGGYVRPLWLIVETEPRSLRAPDGQHVPGSGPGIASGTPYWGIWSLN